VNGIARVLRPLLGVKLSPEADALVRSLLLSSPAEGEAKKADALPALQQMLSRELPDVREVVRLLDRAGFAGVRTTGLSPLAARGGVEAAREAVEAILAESRGRAGVGEGHEAGPEKRLARFVEAHHQVNSQPAAGRGDYLLFPCFFADAAGGGEWMFSYEGDEKSAGAGEESCRLSFFLTMSNLGDICLEVSKTPQGLYGAFTLTDREAADHVRRGLDGLRETLEPIFGQVSFTCRASSQSAVRRFKEELAAKSGRDEFVLVDVTA